MSHSSWQYDEKRQIGKDYGSVAEVEAYDLRHSKFRDFRKESEEILDHLAVRREHVILDMGTGTGTFAIEAAKRCSKVFAVDVSPTMLEYAKKKADAQGIGNIVFCQGGFLTYAHSEAPVDRIVTSLALHHLPDFWKFVALNRLSVMLKDGGKLLLRDVVFSDEHYMENITKWIANLEHIADREIAEDVRMHVQKEYSTFTWIMEGLLTRAGFRIDQADYQDGVLARYSCTKLGNRTQSVA